MKLCVLPDFEALSREAAELFGRLADEYIEMNGRFAVAVSGGSTPIRLYQMLGSEPYRQAIKWSKVHFFWADERFLPYDHPASNYRVLHENLLSKISLPPENIHPVKTGVRTPAISAELYENEIRNFFGLSGCGSTTFDLVLLGMGEDGHTASLFPGSQQQDENRLAAPASDQKHEYPRVTLTPAAINAARNVVFLISGKQKAIAVKKVIYDKDLELPASLVEPKNGDLFYLLDEDAAMLLPGMMGQ